MGVVGGAPPPPQLRSLTVWPILRPSQKVMLDRIFEKKRLLAAAAGSVSANSCFFGRRLANGRDGARRCAERARQPPRAAVSSIFAYPGAKIQVGCSRRLPAPIRPTGPSVEPQITIGSIARRVGRNGAGSRRVRTPHFLGFVICIKLFSFFRRSRRLSAPFRPSGPSFEPHFSVRCIARRVGRNGAGSGRKRHPLPNSTRITEEIVFSTRCSASLLCAANACRRCTEIP